jgi:hypothetical protein
MTTDAANVMHASEHVPEPSTDLTEPYLCPSVLEEIFRYAAQSQMKCLTTFLDLCHACQRSRRVCREIALCSGGTMGKWSSVAIILHLFEHIRSALSGGVMDQNKLLHILGWVDDQPLIASVIDRADIKYFHFRTKPYERFIPQLSLTLCGIDMRSCRINKCLTTGLTRCPRYIHAMKRWNRVLRETGTTPVGRSTQAVSRCHRV